MTKVIKIDNCQACPYCIDTLDINEEPIDACYFGHIEIKDKTKTADFCPLEDYKDK